MTRILGGISPREAFDNLLNNVMWEGKVLDIELRKIDQRGQWLILLAISTGLFALVLFVGLTGGKCGCG